MSVHRVVQIDFGFKPPQVAMYIEPQFGCDVLQFPSWFKRVIYTIVNR